MTSDEQHMRAALSLARRGLGECWPNPAVGCVLVREDVVVGRGRTAPGGRPHAETAALAMAGPLARGATAYVTLEPCAHHGRTPPCADALLAAGVSRVVAAIADPDPRVDGAGLARLRAGGVAVELGLLAEEAAEVTRGFLLARVQGRPLLTLKLASTLDGRIATAAGESRWITGPAARRRVHALRGAHDAVLVGIGTALADDPELTCRIPGLRTRPVVRVVADRLARLPLGSRLVSGARIDPTWILHDPHAPAGRLAALEASGVQLLAVPEGAGGLDLPAALRALAAAGLTRVLAEGGAALAASLLRAGLVDRVAWFHAPALLGADARAATSVLGLGHLTDMPRLRRVSLSSSGTDSFSEFIPLPPGDVGDAVARNRDDHRLGAGPGDRGEGEGADVHRHHHGVGRGAGGSAPRRRRR